MAVWAFLSDWPLYMRVSAATFGAGAALFVVNQVRHFVRERSQPPAAPLQPEALAVRRRSLADQLASYRSGFFAIRKEIEKSPRVLGTSLGKRFAELQKAVVYTILAESKLFTGNVGRRFIGPHPESPLHGDPAWEHDKFELWRKVDSTICHLYDLQTELGHQPGNTLEFVVDKGARG